MWNVEHDRTDVDRTELEGLAIGLRVGVDVLLGLAQAVSNRPAAAPPGMELAALPLEPAGPEYVASLHAAVPHLIGLDNQFGGDDIAGLAVRTFRGAKGRLEAGLYRPGVELDLQAAAGELAEVAGWLLHDAGQEEASRQLGHESLMLSRLSGDRSMEHLVLANVSLQALFQRRPGEALQIARAEQARGGLSPRLQVIFGIREARALAQLGDDGGTKAALARAVDAFGEGPGRLDPAWAWWVDGSEFALHRGLALADLGDQGGALRLLQQAVEDCPPRRRNARFIYLVQFLRSLIAAGAWRDAEVVLRETAGLAGEVGSTRTRRMLCEALDQLVATAAPSTLRDMAQRMRASGC